LQISRRCQIDETLLQSRNKDFDILLEILQIEVEHFNKLEQQRSIVAMRVSKTLGNPETHLRKVFDKISDNSSPTDQRFVSFELFNIHLREAYGHSILDMEDFVLFNMSCNNYYDNDSEISENEFVMFMLPFRKQSQTIYRVLAKRLGKCNAQEDLEALKDIIRECEYENADASNNFLDNGAGVERSLMNIGNNVSTRVADQKQNIMHMIRRGGIQQPIHDYDSFNPTIEAPVSPSSKNNPDFPVSLNQKTTNHLSNTQTKTHQPSFPQISPQKNEAYRVMETDEIDEESFGQYKEVRFEDTSNTIPHQNRDLLDEKVRRNIEKYEFKL